MMWSQDTLLTADDLRSQTSYFTNCGWFAITNKIFYWQRMICDHKQDILLTADDVITRYFTDCGWYAITNKIFYWLRMICDHKQDILLTADDRRSQTRYFTDCGWHVITRYFTDCGWYPITNKIFYRTLPGKLSLRIHINTVCCKKNKIYNCDYVLKKTTNYFNEEI